MAGPSSFVNRVYVNIATTGTGTVTLGTVKSNAFNTMADAGAVNGKTFTYVLEEGTDYEIGRGVYTSATPSLSRATVLISKIAGSVGTTKMTLAGAATLRIIDAAEDKAGLISSVPYTSTQTITIPDGATRAVIRMWAPGGGAGGGGSAQQIGYGASGGGGLYKVLTGLTPGNTLAYTQGAVGAAGTSNNSGTATDGTDAGNSTLASGTQTISTLTCNGGKKGPKFPTSITVQNISGGTASGGDININGQMGISLCIDATSGNPYGLSPGGMCGLGFARGGNGGQGGSSPVQPEAGQAGGLIIDWYY